MSQSKPVRILLVHERYRQYGGEDAVFDAQSTLFERMGHPVERLVVDNEEIDERGVAGRIRLATTTVWSDRGIRDVLAAARRFRPDVVHVHNTFPLLSPAIYGSVRRLGPAVVQTLHNYRLVCVNGLLFRDGHPCEDCVGKPVALPGVWHACYRDSRAASTVVAAMLAFHRARGTWRRDVDVFVALAPFARNRLVRGGVPRSRIAVVPNFVEPAIKPATPAGEGEGLLFVGRLTVDKGVQALVDAWRMLPTPGHILRIAGDGPLRSTVEAAARSVPGIEYLGPLSPEAVRREMERARCVAVPSLLYENCPMTVLEAFASGRPVIATGQGALGDLVVDGETGFHARPADAADLARVALRALGDPGMATAMGLAAVRTYEREFSPNVAYERLVRVFDMAIARRAGTARPS